MTDDDRLVADYLRRLRRAARGLPAARRRELTDEISGHIAEARAAGAAHPPGESVPAILARLGEPGEIVRASGGPALATRPGGLEITAVILLVAGGFLFVVGWVAGLVLLWASPRWRWPDKLLGTLVWPGGLLGLAAIAALAVAQTGGQSCAGGAGITTTCTGSSAGHPWVGIVVLAAAVLAEALVAIRLLRRARWLPEPEPDPATPQSSLL